MPRSLICQYTGRNRKSRNRGTTRESLKRVQPRADDAIITKRTKRPAVGWIEVREGAMANASEPYPDQKDQESLRFCIGDHWVNVGD